jgi:hypothetical protein
MAPFRSGARAGRTLAVAASVVLLLGWVGCAASQDDGEPADLDDVAGEPGSSSGSSSSGSSAGEPTRPAFEAGFDDDDDAGAPPDGDDVCLDPDDPGSSPSVAKALPDTDDCDNSIKTVNGIMNGAVDVDYYRLSGTDRGGCRIDATFESTTPGLELCVGLRCKKGATKFDSCAHGVLSTMDGANACCSATPGKALPKWSCGGVTQLDDSVDISIRVRQPTGGACLPYTLSYRF